MDKKKRIWIGTGVCLVLAVGCGIGFLAAYGNSDEVTYREVQAEYGELTVGLEESGNVTVGTTEQARTAFPGDRAEAFFRGWEVPAVPVLPPLLPETW